MEIRISALLTIGVAILLFGGCAARPPRGLQICPGKATVAEALATLAQRVERAVPLRSGGRAVLTYHVPDKKGTERHALTLEFRFEPPGDIYLQGNSAVIPNAVIMGSNGKEFWLALRPKEISSYYRGQWQDVGDFEGLMMSPRVVLEAMGIVIEPAAAPNETLWTLRNEGPYDILTRRDETGRIAKRVYVYTCDYTVRKVEYFDRRGQVAAIAQLDEYQPVVEGFAVPTRIDIVSTGPSGQKDSIVMTLGTVRTTEFNDKQRQRLFNPPPADRFEHIYHYEEGRWVPE